MCVGLRVCSLMSDKRKDFIFSVFGLRQIVWKIFLLLYNSRGISVHAFEFS